MSAQKIITSLEKLVKLHAMLFDKAIYKTEIIKKGDIEALKEITIDERTYVKAVNTLQIELLANAENFLKENAISLDQPTLSLCIDCATGEERLNLTSLKTSLQQKMLQLKQQNDINQQLLEQSLQFVNLSLELLLPDDDSINYERPEQKRPFDQEGRSFFDSKA